ncbi:LysR family transcriptional regulator [Nocardia sp. 2]|uniref:LysR family transcriptional regulator n=1 Tax=Nocardia acididurans TaxID=2802282 RepID=A0ABS1MBX5_9NOCA|nr:LysR substrate-binding domain-containing protein [Nocardia acididurans]MBL1078163.1 LysR family transcriptional regulator [Nocardia acididurans]
MLERLELEAFLTLAEELHFGRTAERLGMSTSRISQTIKNVERRIGAPLFERTSRTVRMTPIGLRLHADIRPGYDQIDAGLRRATASARGIGGTLTVGFLGAAAGSLTLRAAHLFSTRHPECEVAFREVQLYEALGALRSGEVEIMIFIGPIEQPDITVGPPLITEQKVLAVPADHPFAQRDSITLEDLAEVRLIRMPPNADFPRELVERHIPERTPSGRPIAAGPVGETWQELLSLVGTGQACAQCDASVFHYYRHRGVEYIPIEDALPMEYLPMWLAGKTTGRILAFVQAALELPGGD